MNFIYSFLYNCILCVLALLSLPKYLIQKKKISHLIFNKWGRGFYTVAKDERPIIWIHAVSVGETKAIAPLASLLKKQFPHFQFLITSVTETGQAEAKRSLPYADYFFYLPFDFSFLIRPIIKHIQPKLLLISETDYWYHLVKLAKSQGAQIAILNGKLSLRSFNRYRIFKRWTQTFFAPVDLFSLQNQTYAKRFQDLGISQEKMFVSGNLKLDAKSPIVDTNENRKFAEQLGLQSNDCVIVAGSTHAQEEKLILDVFAQLLNDYSNLKLLLVPRHPERFKEVLTLIKRYALPCGTYTQPQPQVKIHLIDTMGILQKCYQNAAIAIVGGSFVPTIGGHNILEPCSYGIPVLFGPWMYNQQDLVELINRYRAGLSTPPELLKTHIQELITDTNLRTEMGQNGLKLVHDQQGITEKNCYYLIEKLKLKSEKMFA